jgi:hypothetical protein
MNIYLANYPNSHSDYRDARSNRIFIAESPEDCRQIWVENFGSIDSDFAQATFELIGTAAPGVEREMYLIQ